MEPKKIHADLAEAMADTMVRRDPEKAKEFCIQFCGDQDKGMGLYDEQLAAFLSEVHSEVETSDRQNWPVLTAALAWCRNRDWATTDANQWPLTKHTIELMAAVVPNVLGRRHAELLDWLMSDEGCWVDVVPSFVSLEALVGRLNGDERIRNLPRVELAKKVEMAALWMMSPQAVSRLESADENPGVVPELWRVYLVGLVLGRLDELISKRPPNAPLPRVRRLIEALDDEESEIVVIEAIKILMSQGDYSEAVYLADSEDFPELRAQAAAAAYERCCQGVTGHQLLEAAELAERWQLIDHHGAAAKWLKELEDRKEVRAVVEWARHYGLPVSSWAAQVYFDRRNFSCDYDPFLAIELALEAGETEQARKAIVELWQKGMRTLNWDLLDYYRRPDGIFGQEAAVEDLGQILAYLGGKDAEEWFLQELEKRDLAGVRPAIVHRAIRKAIATSQRAEVERFVADHLGKVDELGLLDMVRESALAKAKARDWREFFRLCQEWELDELLAIVADLEKLIPEQERPAEPPGHRFARAAGISV